VECVAAAEVEVFCEVESCSLRSPINSSTVKVALNAIPGSDLDFNPLQNTTTCFPLQYCSNTTEKS